MPISLSALDATRRPSSWTPVSPNQVLSWSSTGADSYDVGWDTASHSGGDVNDPTLYPNRLSVGASTSWTNNTGQTVYAAVRSVVGGELGPWSSEESLTP